VLQLLVTGFGPFPGVPENPSERLAHVLANEPPPGWSARARVLSVAFARVGPELDAALAEGACDLVLGLGVHRGPYLRIERRARRDPTAQRPDNDGTPGVAVPRTEDTPFARATELELAPLLAALSGAPATWPRPSGDAGGYVCEHTYYHLLGAARAHGARGLFVHVAPTRHLPLALQARALRCLVVAAGAQLCGAAPSAANQAERAARSQPS